MKMSVANDRMRLASVEERHSALPIRNRLAIPATGRDGLIAQSQKRDIERLLASNRDNSFRGAARAGDRGDYPKMTIKAASMQITTKRSRYESDSPSPSEHDEEPLLIQVDFNKPKKSKRRSSDPIRVRRTADIRYHAAPMKPGDLRYSMKSQPSHPPPKYNSPSDLRFSIKRPTTESKRKKTRPPALENEEECEPYPDTTDEELLKETAAVTQTASGSVIRFDSSDEEEGGGEGGEEEKENTDQNAQMEVEEGVEEGASEAEEEVVEVKEEQPAPVENQSAEESGSSSSDSDGSSSSGSGSSSSESEGEEEAEEDTKTGSKSVQDLRDKYDSVPSTPTPLSSRLAAAKQEREAAAEKERVAALAEVERVAAVKQEREATEPVKKSKPKEVSSGSKSRAKHGSSSSKRDAPVSSAESQTSETARKPVQKRVKTRSKSSRSEQAPQITKEQILSKLQSDGEDSFSDGGEDERAHSGALAVVEEPKKIVPIFPFKTRCKPGLFPESKVPFIDSHCHIDYLFVREHNYGSFASYVESKDFPKNFSGCVANFCDPPAWTSDEMYSEILEEDGVWAAFGLHPHNAGMWNREIEKNLIKAASHPKCVAWGEMGLDYGKKATPDAIELQKDAFIAQIKLGLRMKKPFVIHGRGAEMDAFEILKVRTYFRLTLGFGIQWKRFLNSHCFMYQEVYSVASQMAL